MQLFYIPNLNPQEPYAIMDEEEARHCLKVLRKKRGDRIQVIDGKGHMYEAEIAGDEVKNCQVRIIAELPDEQARSFKLTIAIAPPKNTDRLEWFLEKATEVGVDKVIPLYTERSERRKLNVDRLAKIMVSAMKQSGKTLLPALEQPVALDKLLPQLKDDEGSQKFIATCFGNERPHLKDIYKRGSNAVILIGPEGDFTEKEAELAQKNGFMPISLGRSRLRLETAGIAACHIVNLLNE
jgi:16S rRNA (uracil1498-N3)-methyltransferase